MTEGFLRLFSARSPGQILRDLLDIFIVAYVIYRALLVLRGTRAIQMGAGLGVVFLVYMGAKWFRLVTLLNLLSWLLSSIILIVVVVFQNDIRRALIRMGGRAWLSGGREQQSRVIDEVVAAATELARHRMGAIIAFEQDANVLEFVKSEGIPLDSAVTRELLVTLFVPEQANKLHDGAVLIRDLKVARAGVFFPMPETKILDASLGSRHRAALGITEETDAVVVVVSEERGTISFCFSGNIVSNLDGQSLRHALLGLFGRSSRKKRFARKVAAATPGGPRPTIPIATPRPSMAMPPASQVPREPAREPISSTKSPAPGTRVTTSIPMRSSKEPERAPARDDGDRLSIERGRPAIVEAPPATPMPNPQSERTPTPKPSTFVPTADPGRMHTPPSTRAPNHEGSESTPSPGDDS